MAMFAPAESLPSPATLLELPFFDTLPLDLCCTGNTSVFGSVFSHLLLGRRCQGLDRAAVHLVLGHSWIFLNPSAPHHRLLLVPLQELHLVLAELLSLLLLHLCHEALFDTNVPSFLVFSFSSLPHHSSEVYQLVFLPQALFVACFYTLGQRQKLFRVGIFLCSLIF